MPSLIDLFKNKKSTNGQTAQTNNAVRNGKDIPITTNSVLLNKNIIPTFNKLRNGFSVDLNKTLGSGAANTISSLNSSLGSPINVTNGVAYVKKDVVKNTYTETLSEENFLGLRPLHLLSTPFLYGTNTIRLTTQSTYAKDLMIANRNATPNSIGGLISSARVAVAGAVNSVGLYPYPVYPSLLIKERYKGRTFEEALGEGDFMDFIYGLKKKSQGIPIIGDLLKGTLQNFRTGLRTNDAMGQYATSAKGLITKIFLGNNRLKFPKTENTLYWSGGVLATLGQSGGYSSDYPYSELKIRIRSSEIRERNDLSDLLELYNNPTDGQINSLTQAKFPVFTPLTLNSSQKHPKKGKTFGNGNQSFELSEDTYNKLKSYLGETKFDGTQTFSKLKVNEDYSLQTKRKMEPGLDSLNQRLPQISSIDEADTTLSDLDFVTLKFKSPYGPTPITARFRATITGLTETVSPQWDTNKFIGNPFPLYTYNQVERQVQFNFKVYSLSGAEHVAMWERLNFLTSLCYPQEYSNVYSANDISKQNNFTHATPPFIEFTLGSMYVDKPAFIDSLTYTVDDTYTWETGVPTLVWNTEGKKWERVSGDMSLNQVFQGGLTKSAPDKTIKNNATTNLSKWILPQIIDVNISLKIVESIYTTAGRRFFTSTPYTGLDDVVVKGTYKEVAAKKAAAGNQ